MKAICSSETLVFLQTVPPYNPEDGNFHSHRCEKVTHHQQVIILITHIIYYLVHDNFLLRCRNKVIWELARSIFIRADHKTKESSFWSSLKRKRKEALRIAFANSNTVFRAVQIRAASATWITKESWKRLFSCYFSSYFHKMKKNGVRNSWC